MATREDKIRLSDMVANCLALLIRKLEYTDDQTDRQQLLCLAGKIYETPHSELDFDDVMAQCQVIRKKYETMPNCPSWQAIVSESNQLHKDITGEDLIVDDNDFDWF